MSSANDVKIVVMDAATAAALAQILPLLLLIFLISFVEPGNLRGDDSSSQPRRPFA